MSTSKLLIGILVTAFALGATTMSASARKTGAGQQSAASASQPGSGIPACGNGTVARYHTVSGVKHWRCVKA